MMRRGSLTIIAICQTQRVNTYILQEREKKHTYTNTDFYISLYRMVGPLDASVNT